MIRMIFSKKSKGFTLIEVIVVAVIIAVLSAVAIPLYNGYIRDSRRNTAENVAGSAASFIGTAVAMGADIGLVEVIVNDAPGPSITAGDWLYSDESQKTELRSFTDRGDTNRFIIPTDIQIQIDDAAKTVVGAHVKSVIATGGDAGDAPDSTDETQAYHYH